MPVNNVKRLLLFFSLYYCAQGIYNAYGGFEQRFLRASGVKSATDIGTARTIAIIPWSVKLLFAIPCDMLGRRLPFVTTGMILGAATLLCIIFFDPKENYAGYVGTVFARNFGIAISDVAVDGMSVDCGLDDMAGTVQGFMSLGRVSGTLMASLIGGVIANKESYQAMIIFLSVCIFCLVPVSFAVKEEKVGKSFEFEWAAFKELSKVSVVCFLIFAGIGDFSGSVGGIAANLWTELIVKLDIEQQGYLNTVGSLGDLVGAIGMGYAFDRMNKRIGILIVSLTSTFSTLLIFVCKDSPSWFALTFFSGIISGAYFVVKCAMVMKLADKRLGASVFAIAVSVMNFSSMIGNAVAGPLTDAYGMEISFWASFGFGLLQLPFIYFIQEPANGNDNNGGKQGRHPNEELLGVKPFHTSNGKSFDSGMESPVLGDVYDTLVLKNVFSSGGKGGEDEPTNTENNSTTVATGNPSINGTALPLPDTVNPSSLSAHIPDFGGARSAPSSHSQHHHHQHHMIPILTKGTLGMGGAIMSGVISDPDHHHHNVPASHSNSTTVVLNPFAVARTTFGETTNPIDSTKDSNGGGNPFQGKQDRTARVEAAMKSAGTVKDD